MKIIKKYKYLVILLIIITLPIAWHYNRLAAKESYKNYCMSTHDPKEIMSCYYDDGGETYTLPAQERYDIFYNNVDKYDQISTDTKDMFVTMFGDTYSNCLWRNEEKGKYHQTCNVKDKNKYFDLQEKCASEGYIHCAELTISSDIYNKKATDKNLLIFNKAMSVKSNACDDKFKEYFDILSNEQKSKLNKEIIDKCNSGKIINK